MHCVAREESSSPAIFSYFWIKTILKKTKRGDMLSLSWPGKLELQVNFCEIALNWILNWIIFQQNSKIELNQFGYQTGLPKTDWKILDTPKKSDCNIMDTPQKSDWKILDTPQRSDGKLWAPKKAQHCFFSWISNMMFMHHQRIISASSAYHQCIISVSSVYHQCIISASSAHHQCIRSA